MPGAFTRAQLDYLQNERRLGRLATVSKELIPRVVPVGWRHNAALDTIDVGGHDLPRTRKFRDVLRHGRAAIVIDDLRTVEPWRPRAIEISGRAEAITSPEPVIRIHPDHVVSWGLE
ncbi:PPOX class F420-dependent oxidoreductase [Nocardia brasiliensis]|uniref:PPOX class F420-dependent oxidoreductase n=1 Tax=Nocardia brasiliensis TaxID=37326 RepID=UPI003D8D131E